MYKLKAEQIFDSLDLSNSGMVTFIEFQKHLESEELLAYLASLDLEPDCVWTLFKLLDVDEGGTLDVAEFLAGVLRLKGRASALNLAILTYEHRHFVTRMNAFMVYMHKSMHHMLDHLGVDLGVDLDDGRHSEVVEVPSSSRPSQHSSLGDIRLSPAPGHGCT